MPIQSRSNTPCPFDLEPTEHADPQAADCLRKLSQQIVEACRQNMDEQHSAAGPSAQAWGGTEALSALLQELADALENPHWRYAQPSGAGAAWRDGLSNQAHLPDTFADTLAGPLAAYIDACALFRHIVCEKMTAHGPWPQATTARIHAFIDAAVRSGVQAFQHAVSEGKARSYAEHKVASPADAAMDDKAVRDALKQRDELQSKAASAQAELRVAKQQRDDAHDAYDASRDDIATLLEHKKMRERVIELLSHDLRSPLSSIVLNAQRLAKNIHNPDLANLTLPRIIRATQRMDHMIQDMLDASRLRAGQSMPISASPCDVALIAAEVHEDFLAALGSRLKLRLPHSACGVWDKGALRRVLDNLVGNAVKYGDPKTEITIDVSDSPQAVRVCVHNFGNPLSEQELTHLFEPYVRTQGAQSGDQVGWGLGLTLVHGIVSAHRGKVGASSNADAGTTFWFELPKQTEASLPPPP